MTTTLLFPRRSTRAVPVGSVTIGGTSPVSIQSMTTTHTRDVEATVTQVHSEGNDFSADSIVMKDAEAEQRFHHRFVACADSPQLLAAWGACSYTVLQISSGAGARAIRAILEHVNEQGHQKLMAAVLSRDPDRAEQAAHEHLQRSARRLAWVLEADQAQEAELLVPVPVDR